MNRKILIVVSAEPEIIFVASIWSENTAELWPSNVLTGDTVCRKSQSYNTNTRQGPWKLLATLSLRKAQFSNGYLDDRVVGARDDLLVVIIVDTHHRTLVAQERVRTRPLAAIPDLDCVVGPARDDSLVARLSMTTAVQQFDALVVLGLP